MSNDGASDVYCSRIVIDLLGCLVSYYAAGPAGKPNPRTRSHLKLYCQASMPSVRTVPDLFSAGTVPANDKTKATPHQDNISEAQADATGEIGWDIVDRVESLAG